MLELSLPDGRTRSIAVAAHPHDETEAGGKVFVGDELGKALSVIEGRHVVETMGGFLQPGGVAAVSEEDAVVDIRANTVTLATPTADAGWRSLPGAGPTHVGRRRG